MKILFLLNRIPFPLNDGGAIAAYKFAEALVNNDIYVEILAYNTKKHFTNPEVLQNISRHYSVVPLDTTIRPFNMLINLLKKIPYSIERFVSEEFIQQLKSILQSSSFDCIHIDHTYLAWCIPYIHTFAPNTPIVQRLHNVEYIIAERLAAGERNILKKYYYNLLAQRTKKYETEYYAQADLLLPLTVNDARRITELGCSTPAHVVQGGVDVNQFTPNPRRHEQTVLLFGSWDWKPNIEGLEYFVQEIYPLLKNKNPQISIHIGGKNPSEYIYQTAKQYGFTVFANVPSAAEFISSYKILLIPLLSGGGMRMKMIEAMACGTVVVSTSVGAEGIPITSGEHCYIANTPSELVESIEEILSSEEQFQRLSKQSRQFSLQYHWDNLIHGAIEAYGKAILRKKMIHPETNKKTQQ